MVPWLSIVSTSLSSAAKLHVIYVKMKMHVIQKIGLNFQKLQDIVSPTESVLLVYDLLSEIIASYNRVFGKFHPQCDKPFSNIENI